MKHLHFKELPSTQLKAIEMIGEDSSFLISAQKQTHGKGRRENKWEDLDNSLSFSFDITPTGKPTLLALEIAVTLTNYFKQDDLALKWPNDIYNSAGKKVIGILVNKEGNDFIVGIGINFGPITDSNDDKFGQLDSGHTLDESHYKELPKKIHQFIFTNRLNDEEIVNEWNERCFHLNKECKVVDENETITGKFIGIGKYGEALLESNGKVEKAYTGSLLFK